MFVKSKYLFLCFIAIMCLSMVNFAVAAPNGANVTSINSNYSSLNDAAGNASAYAGNVSEIILYGLSNTQSWQGYYGNVSGAIQLADGGNFVMYNWSLANPSGEVYASTNGTIQWTNIQCFNFTAAGNYTAETGNGGTTSLYGRNVTQLESLFNFPVNSSDGVDETFTLIGAGTHDAFFVGASSFSEGECKSTRVFDSSGSGNANNFEEVLLYEPDTSSVVFTSLLENNVNAFNNKSSDFEMLVLEDGHSGDTSATPYYFFIELQ